MPNMRTKGQVGEVEMKMFWDKIVYMFSVYRRRRYSQEMESLLDKMRKSCGLSEKEHLRYFYLAFCLTIGTFELSIRDAEFLRMAASISYHSQEELLCLVRNASNSYPKEPETFLH